MPKQFLAVLLLMLGVASLAQAAPASTLDRVIDHGYVRVCTTGDYKPFTYFNPKTKKYQGIDIDMARDLGHALGVDVRFVRTSWSTLMKDFTAGKCDIAMGGISVNLDRQKQAYFTEPYLTDGKTPITLCKNVDRFQTLKQIDQPDVTVVVNPGGSNERFARSHLQQAKILVHKDNTTIFDEIIDGKADLMITDGTETVLQSKLHPELCAVHPDKPFTYSEMGYLLPRGDNVWKAWVDQWLHLSKATGHFKAIYAKWLK